MMAEFEKKVMKLFIEAVKEVGGRGPKNVLVKVENEIIVLTFWLMKSNFEIFLYEEIEGGKTMLAEIYEKIAVRIGSMLAAILGEHFLMAFVYLDFEHDISSDKYSMRFKRIL